MAAKSGLPPGSLVHVGDKVAESVRISMVTYDESQVQFKEDVQLQDLFKPGDGETLWIMVQGLHEVRVVEAIGSYFQLHPLILEDILNTTQRPKIEDLGDYLFVVLRMLHQEDDSADIGSEQVSMVIGPNLVLTFLESHRAHFQGVTERIRSGKGRIRRGGSDYLAYCIIDAVVDKYFVVLERLAERIELLEEQVATHPTPDTVQGIHKLKTGMVHLRRSIWPLREVLSRLVSGQSSLIRQVTLPYLRDVYDHAIHVIDAMETYRDIVSGMLDIYLSSVSNKLNEIMKVLTIIATLFIPLTFVTSWYGMNFKTMPELDWRWGYPMVVAIAVSISITMLITFRRRGWI
jgi:magnesium transporter